VAGLEALRDAAVDGAELEDTAAEDGAADDGTADDVTADDVAADPPAGAEFGAGRCDALVHPASTVATAQASATRRRRARFTAAPQRAAAPRSPPGRAKARP
jgi:hypothetical protein